jgi:hypothetical protein
VREREKKYKGIKSNKEREEGMGEETQMQSLSDSMQRGKRRDTRTFFFFRTLLFFALSFLWRHELQ